MSPDVLLFPFGQYWWFYALFTGLVLVLLAVDLGIFHRDAREVTFREAATWSTIWVALALIFNVAFYQYALLAFPGDERLMVLPGLDLDAAARQVALEFLTGYLVEYSLAIDNIFVFVLVFSYFAIPRKYQHRVLFYGILGALIFRAIFIAMGASLMQYHWVVLLFGVFLIVTGIKMILAADRGLEPDKNPMVRLFRRFVSVTPKLHGPSFFIRQGGVLYATPLLVTLLFVEVSDIIFAIDSVPAIYALTREPLVVFTSNVFAIMGLRSMFFMISGVLDKFHLLKYGLAVVLVFVGLKMVWLDGLYGGKFPIGLSLGIISGVIGASIVLSLLFPKHRTPGVHDVERQTE